MVDRLIYFKPLNAFFNFEILIDGTKSNNKLLAIIFLENQVWFPHPLSDWKMSAKMLLLN
jgi:hypothetical protein